MNPEHMGKPGSGLQILASQAADPTTRFPKDIEKALRGHGVQTTSPSPQFGTKEEAYHQQKGHGLLTRIWLARTGESLNQGKYG